MVNDMLKYCNTACPCSDIVKKHTSLVRAHKYGEQMKVNLVRAHKYGEQMKVNYHWRELPQVSFLSRQSIFCYVFVVTIFLPQQVYFVMTRRVLS